MTATEITKIFECFGLATQEQRDRILSQGNFAQPETVKVTTWFSNETNDSREGDANFAKLENTSR